MAKPSYLLIDLGAVIYDIDYQKTIDAMSELFKENLSVFFSKKQQWEQVDAFEEGKISGKDFCEFLKQTFKSSDINNKDIENAWNALLIGFRESTVAYLETLSKTTDLFLFSNTNEFHYQELSQRAGNEFMDRFHACFKTVYLSHTLNQRKPNVNAFLTIIKKEGLRAEDGLFIDDTLRHVKGAQNAGLQTYHFKDGDRLEDILPKLM